MKRLQLDTRGHARCTLHPLKRNGVRALCMQSMRAPHDLLNFVILEAAVVIVAAFSVGAMYLSITRLKHEPARASHSKAGALSKVCR